MKITACVVLLAMLLAPPPALSAEKAVIADKTIVAWVTPANLEQRGGSVLTVEKSGVTPSGRSWLIS